MTDPLVEEATKRSGVVWVRPEGTQRDRVVWHVWHDGAAYLVTGGAEQALPPMSRCLVLVRSREKQAGRLVQWEAEVSAVAPGTPLWDEVVPLLHAERLNAVDGEEQPARWARESTVLRLAPTGTTVPTDDAPADVPTAAGG